MTVYRDQRKQLLLEFIAAYHDQHGYVPSYKAIAERFHLKSKSGAYLLMKALEEDGLVEQIPKERHSGQYVMKYRPEVTM